ncbi:hypothetical protein ACDZ29_25435 [Peribacillus sp. RS7]|uniref:hypothetical protein n=1 Tax=Peribacillus sp. RS7 TaxID=3242679 RepID=UPI0035BEC9B8
MGFNIFNPKAYVDNGLGYSHSFSGVLEPNTEGKYILHYDLGINEETTEVPIVPSKEQLDKLKNNGLEATLIVLSGN